MPPTLEAPDAPAIDEIQARAVSVIDPTPQPGDAAWLRDHPAATSAQSYSRSEMR